MFFWHNNDPRLVEASPVASRMGHDILRYSSRNLLKSEEGMDDVGFIDSNLLPSGSERMKDLYAGLPSMRATWTNEPFGKKIAAVL